MSFSTCSSGDGWTCEAQYYSSWTVTSDVCYSLQTNYWRSQCVHTAVMHNATAPKWMDVLLEKTPPPHPPARPQPHSERRHICCVTLHLCCGSESISAQRELFLILGGRAARVALGTGQRGGWRRQRLWRQEEDLVSVLEQLRSNLRIFCCW